MTKGVIYLGFTCCHEAPKVPKSRLSRGKWNPEKIVRCPNCDSPCELSELEWFEKTKIIYFRPMNHEELLGLSIMQSSSRSGDNDGR